GVGGSDYGKPDDHASERQHADPGRPELTDQLQHDLRERGGAGDGLLARRDARECAVVRARILSSQEWGLLERTELPPLLPYINPENAAMVVVEEEGRVVASLAALRATHLE